MYNNIYLDFRIQNAETIDELNFEKGNKSRSHSRVHSLFIQELLGVTENTTQNYRRKARAKKNMQKPAAYIVATLQMLGPLHACTQMGISMPKPGRLTLEYLAEYFTKAMIEEEKFNAKKNKTVKKKLPVEQD